MSKRDTAELAEMIRDLSDALGISPERLLAAATMPEQALEEVDDTPQPARIVYPNIKYKGYKYREYPKAFYRGVVRDVEEPYVRVEKDGKQTQMIKVLPDQFVWELKEVRSKAEEVHLTKDWLPTLALAKEAAIAAKEGNKKPAYELKEVPAADEDLDETIESAAARRRRARKNRTKKRAA